MDSFFSFEFTSIHYYIKTDTYIIIIIEKVKKLKLSENKQQITLQI